MPNPDDQDAIAPPTVEGVEAGVVAPEIPEGGDAKTLSLAVDTRTAVMQALLATRKDAVTDKRLLNAEGIVSIARELGVDFPDATFTLGNVEAFLEACERVFKGQKYYLLNQAFVYLAQGQAALDNGNFPSYAGNEFEEPTQAYIAALELVDKWLDFHRADRGDVTKEDVDIFRRKRWTDAWKRSVDAAKAVGSGVVGKLKDTVSGEETQLGKQTTTYVLLHDAAHRYVGAFPTFDLGSTTLGASPELAQRRIQGTRASNYRSLIINFSGDGSGLYFEPKVRIQGDSASFLNKLFPASEFPDRSLLNGIKVETVIGVIPIAADRPEALFQVHFDGGKEQYRIDIMTGENLHGAVVNTHGGILQIGLPSSIGYHEEFFSARSPEILSDARSQHAAEVGKEASTSVVLVITPVVNGAKATFRRKVLHYRMGTLPASKLAKEMLDNPEAEAVLILQNSGWITPVQAEEINGALAAEREARASWEVDRPARVFAFDLGGGDSVMESFGSHHRGVGGSGYGTAFHTGRSGIGTGAQYGKLEEELDPDPFARPKILVVKPFGISEHDKPEEASARIASVVDIKSRERT